MENKYSEEQKYSIAKKRVEKIKGFYWHLITYVIVNVIISVTIIIGLINEDKVTFGEAISNFGVLATWLFWGIGLFFHWLGVFGTSLFFSKKWEERKIRELMDKD